MPPELETPTLTTDTTATPPPTPAPAITPVTPPTPAPVAAAPAADDANSIDHLPAAAQEMIRSLRRESAGYRIERNEERARAAAAAQEAAGAAARLSEAEARAAAASADAARFAAIGAALTAEIEREIAGWPPEVLSLRPPGASAPDLIAWRDAHRPIVTRIQAAAPAAGQTPAPSPTGSASRAPDRQLADAAAAKLRSTF